MYGKNIIGLGSVKTKKQLFEKIYKKYRNKNYFFTDDRIKRKLKEWEYFKEQGDKNALKIKKTQIVNFIEKDNKDKAYYTFSSIKNAIDNNDKEFLISRIRYDQPFSKEIYEKITETKLPKTNKAIRDFFK